MGCEKTSFVFIGVLLIGFVLFFSSVSAWDFYGYTYDTEGNILYNASINITIWAGAPGSPPTLIGSNFTYSNETGWFNLTVTENPTWMYKPIIRHFSENKTDGSTHIDYIGQSLPHLPFSHIVNTTDINFYLGEAGTINITAVNATGSPKNFKYQVKDTLLGFPIEEEFENEVSEAIVYVPKDRNYSIMIYPNEAMPVTFNWNNFSANLDYDISGGPSNYNSTTNTLEKVFNCTDSLLRISGYINATNISGWEEFTVVPFLLEPGDMVYMGDNAGMPYNMSAWNGQTDIYNFATGFYNITLPGPVESVTYILFATAKNDTGVYYGGYRNLTLSYSSSEEEINFTMYPLMSNDWGSANSNISLNNPIGSGTVNVSSAKQQFTLINSTNDSITRSNAHIEVKVDYSEYGALEFTFMLSASGASFYLPLINETGIKEMNIYSKSYAPKRVGKRTPVQILANNNLTLYSFNPGDIGGEIDGSDIFIKLHKYNSTCNVPNAPSSCNVVSQDSQTRDDFNPLSAIIGGGKLNFRMGYGNIEVVYINVDMIASGPPDVSFDSEADVDTVGDFEAAMRFGSGGPRIYDYVMVSFPYTPGSTTQTGLNESADVNMSIPYLYDESWNMIWNATANGTDGDLLAGNESHYYDKKAEWEILMQQNNCTRNESELNSTNPCYIDTNNNRIWIRLPHFSGTQPNVVGSLITATTTDNGGEVSSTGGGGGGTAIPPIFAKAHSWIEIVPGIAAIMKDFDDEIGIKEIIINVNNPAQNVKITVTKHDNKPAEISVERTGKVYQYIEIDAENLENDFGNAVVRFRVEKSWVNSNLDGKESVGVFKYDEAMNRWDELPISFVEEDATYYYYDVELDSFSYFAIGESLIAETEDEIKTPILDTEGKNLTWLWVLILVVVLGVLWFAFEKKGKKRKN